MLGSDKYNRSEGLEATQQRISYCGCWNWQFEELRAKNYRWQVKGWTLRFLWLRYVEGGVYIELVTFDSVCPADKAIRGGHCKIWHIRRSDLLYNTELALPLKDSLIVREGPACRVCGCAPQGLDPQRLSIGHLHDNYPSELIYLETVYPLVRGDVPKITVQQTQGFRQELISSALQARDGIAH